MAGHIWIKVVGFTDTERHSLNTLFRLSSGNPTSYALWTEQVGHPPQIAIVDFDSYEAGLETSLPSFNANLKIIGVGAQVSDKTWRSFTRPVDWGALVRTLGELYSPHIDTVTSADRALDSTIPLHTSAPPGQRAALMVGFGSFDSFYLRARLALAGITDADIAQSTDLVHGSLLQRSYDIAIICLDKQGGDPWAIVNVLKERAKNGLSVVMAGSNPSVESVEIAEKIGSLGVLEMPFSPRQVQSLFQKV